jgi:hypothetical protein
VLSGALAHHQQSEQVVPTIHSWVCAEMGFPHCQSGQPPWLATTKEGTEMMCKPVSNRNEEANEYCHSIVHEVLALEGLVTGSESFDANLEDHLRDLWVELAESVGEEPLSYEPSVSDYVNLYCLEFITLGERSNATDEWSPVGARLLRTYGGPNAFIEWRDTNFIIVKVYWGNERAEARLLAPNIAAALEKMANVLS